VIANTGGRLLLGRAGPPRVPSARVATFIEPLTFGVEGLVDRAEVSEEGCSGGDAGEAVKP